LSVDPAHRIVVPGSLADQPSPGAFYEDVSAIFQHPEGGKLFIGNIRAASNKATLEQVRQRVSDSTLSKRCLLEPLFDAAPKHEHGILADAVSRGMATRGPMCYVA
jgi:hypothetical protein